MEFFSFVTKMCLLIAEDWKLVVIITTLIALYFHYTSTFDYFKKKGLPYMKPVILLGNLGPRLKATKSYHQNQLDIYEYFKGNPYGACRRPLLNVDLPKKAPTIPVHKPANYGEVIKIPSGLDLVVGS